MSSDGSSPVVFRRAGRLLNRRALAEFAGTLSQELTGGRSFTCLLSDDRELHRLNLQFLKHDYPTDVLSFPAPNGKALGDIAISVEQAAEQATEYGHSLEDEVRLLMLHGVLHLLGMDHAKDSGAMKRQEDIWRRRFGLPGASLIARAK